MGSKLSTRLVTGYIATAGRLLTTHLIPNSLDPLRSSQLARDWKQMLMWNNLTLDTNFFSAVMEALVPQWAKCLDVNSDYMAVWCVPCATHGGLMCTVCCTWRSDVYHVQQMAVWCVPRATNGSLMCTTCNKWQSDVYHMQQMAVSCVSWATHGGLMCTMSNTWRSDVYHVQQMAVWCVPCATNGGLMCTMCNTYIRIRIKFLASQECHLSF